MKQVMTHEQKHNPVHLADLKLIDIPQTTVNGHVVECSAQLFQLLLFFCENPNYVFSKEEIYEKVWGAPAYNGDDNTVMVTFENYVKKLNKTQVNQNI